MKVRRRTIAVALAAALLAASLAWRFVRPLNIFVVSDAFERPVATDAIPASLGTLRAEDCAACHRAFYDEWRATIHSQPWTDPYFQVDWRFDGAQQICKDCNTPLDRQQESLVLGFRDRDKWEPILAANPAFDRALQHEGVTCAACHFRASKILGIRGAPRMSRVEFGPDAHPQSASIGAVVTYHLLDEARRKRIGYEVYRKRIVFGGEAS